MDSTEFQQIKKVILTNIGDYIVANIVYTQVFIDETNKEQLFSNIPVETIDLVLSSLSEDGLIKYFDIYNAFEITPHGMDSYLLDKYTKRSLSKEISHELDTLIITPGAKLTDTTLAEKVGIQKIEAYHFLRDYTDRLPKNIMIEEGSSYFEMINCDLSKNN